MPAALRAHPALKVEDLTALQAEHDALLGFLYLCPVGLVRTTAQGEVELINPQAAQMLLPLTRQPVLQNLFDALENCAPELRDMAARFAAPSGSVCQQHRIHVSRTGPGLLVIACTLVKINANCLMAVLQDVTQQVAQERELRNNEAMIAALVAGVNDFALFSLDRGGRIDGWNGSGQQQTGFTTADVLGRDLSVLAAGLDAGDKSVAEQVQDAGREGWSVRERWCIRRDGSRYWCQIMVAANQEAALPITPSVPTGAPFKRSTVIGFAVVLRDITQRHINGEELRRLLTADSLTGAANRSHFFDVAEVELARSLAGSRPLSAIMLDVDHFKQVNDCFGHAGGDLVLRQLVTLCRTQLRGRDLLGRMGGEEFVILLPDTGLAEAVMVAERIRLTIAAELSLPAAVGLAGDIPPMAAITVSLGCATLTADIANVDMLLKQADQALYGAKRAGRNLVHAWGDVA
jgi:diguanylate cyclase (GGDEF)-like protein/PAS domain S-box-containing protein